MIQRIAFNIETEADLAKVAQLPEPEVALGNTKDPIKVAEKYREANEKVVEKMALDANFGRVVAISISLRELPEDEQIKTVSVVRAPDAIPIDTLAGFERQHNLAEASLLTWFWGQVAAHEWFVTFNGAAFDIPFLLRRSLLLNVRPCRIDCHKYNVLNPENEHLDVMNILHQWETGAGGYSRNLEFYAAMILGEKRPEGMTPGKGEIGDLFRAGEYQKIKDVCGWNCEMILRLAEKIAPVYG